MPWQVVRVFTMIENEDYELIPDGDIGSETWNIRILKGDFVETVISFGKITVNEDAESLTFDFNIVSTPDPDLDVKNLDLQKSAGMLLYSIIESSLKENK